MFCFYVWDRHRFQQAAKDREADGSEFREGGYEPPGADELMAFPWRGEGPDPLRPMRQ